MGLAGGGGRIESKRSQIFPAFEQRTENLERRIRVKISV